MYVCGENKHCNDAAFCEQATSSPENLRKLPSPLYLAKEMGTGMG